MKQIYADLIYMLSCSVNGITPDAERVQGIDLDKLCWLAQRHSVRGAVCIALERSGVQHKEFHQAYKKAIRKNIYLDMEREAIISDLEKQGIWYMPLKGAVLQDLYPENGMREMADNDILFDPEKREQIKEIMLSHGYTAEQYGVSNHDVYIKPPMLNFEMHNALFGESHTQASCRYYRDTKRLLIKDEGNGFGYHFSDEDLYVYITAHEWNHFISCGTGLRSLLDCYIYCKAKGSSLDGDRIGEQCRQLEMEDHEQKRRKLAMKIFSSEKLPALTHSEEQLLNYYLTSGVYGTVDNYIKKKLKGRTKAGYVLGSIFPGLSHMRQAVGFVDRCPLLYPAGLVYRWWRILTGQRNELRQAVKTVSRYGK